MRRAPRTDTFLVISPDTKFCDPDLLLGPEGLRHHRDNARYEEIGAIKLRLINNNIQEDAKH